MLIPITVRFPCKSDNNSFLSYKRLVYEDFPIKTYGDSVPPRGRTVGGS